MKRILIVIALFLGLQLAAEAQINRVRINRGSRNTRTNIVTLQIAAFDVKKMQISNNPDFRDAHWIGYKPNVYGWKLKSGEGKQKVYVRFMDLQNKVLDAVEDDINLDVTPPKNPKITIVAEGEFLTDPTKPVKLKAYAENVRYMMLSNSRSFFQKRWQIYNEEIPEWEFSASRDGVKVVFAKFRDKAGNVSETVFDKVTIDTQGPLRSQVVINNDEDFTADKERKVKLHLHSVGATEVRISNEEAALESTDWVKYNQLMDWQLAEGDGARKVWVQFKDNAGNKSEVVSDEIYVDTTPPQECAMVINNGEAISRHLNGIVQLELKTNKEHTAEFVMISNNKDFRGARWEIFEAPEMVITDWRLTNENGLKTVYVKFKDAAENEGEVISAQIKLIR